MDLPLYKKPTEQQIEDWGPIRKVEEIETVRRVYETPFFYDNVEIGDFYEIDPWRGNELKADTGYITITEDRPIIGVTIVGSGCTQNGYNIVEWWDDGESIDNMKDQLVKRQRVDGLKGIHPSVWTELFRKSPWTEGHTYQSVTEGEVKDALDCFKRLTHGFYENLEMSFYENTTYFRVGEYRHRPKKITVRAGCKGMEDPGTSIARYPADYAVRLVELTVEK